MNFQLFSSRANYSRWRLFWMAAIYNNPNMKFIHTWMVLYILQVWAGKISLVIFLTWKKSIWKITKINKSFHLFLLPWQDMKYQLWPIPLFCQSSPPFNFCCGVHIYAVWPNFSACFVPNPPLFSRNTCGQVHWLKKTYKNNKCPTLCVQGLNINNNKKLSKNNKSHNFVSAT